MKLETLENRMRRGMQSQRGSMVSAIMLLPVAAGGFGRFFGGADAWWKWALGGVALLGLASYAWRHWSEAKRLRGVYGDRLVELLDSTYHAIAFTDRNEAAAFVAALGRQLHAPNADLASFEEDVEIAATANDAGITLYLSDGAMRAFTTAFAAPPASRPIIGRDLPTHRLPLLVGTPTEPIGRDDVLKRLDAKFEPLHLTGHLTARS